MLSTFVGELVKCLSALSAFYSLANAVWQVLMAKVVGSKLASKQQELWI